jgi:CheY-like chemotaxis protein
LGLATVHGIIKNHGGAIKVYSEVGAGTTFHVFFPRIESKAPASAATTGPIPLGLGEKILLVDDEPALVQMNSEILGKWGYDVVGYSESPRALEAFMADPGAFDLVMTDLTMPQMTGLELARRIMAVRPKVPIVLMTGFSEATTLEKARLLGISEFILKPAGSRELAQCISRVLHREGEG